MRGPLVHRVDQAIFHCNIYVRTRRAKPCTDYHVKAAREARASDKEIKRAVADALAVRRGATEIMEGYALAKLGAEAHGSNSGRASETNRVKALVCVGAVLCTQQRCSRVVPQASRSAFQKPSAPSPVPSSGAIMRPRRLRSSSASRHDWALAR